MFRQLYRVAYRLVGLAGTLLLVATLAVACGTAQPGTPIPTHPAPVYAPTTTAVTPTSADLARAPGGLPQTGSTPAASPTETVVGPGAGAQATATGSGPTAGPTSSDGSQPSVTISDPTIADGKLTVDEAVSSGPGWITIHAQEAGTAGPVVGYAPVKDGRNDRVVVTLDLSKVTETMYAMLHVDRGIVGTYEFPGPDVPVQVGGQVVMPAFKIQVAQEKQVEVQIANFNFSPYVLVIYAGTEVTWRNMDQIQHTATSDTKLWDSGLLAQGKTFSFTFDHPGLYPYYCRPHGGPGGEGMSAYVLVLPKSG